MTPRIKKHMDKISLSQKERICDDLQPYMDYDKLWKVVSDFTKQQGTQVISILYETLPECTKDEREAYRKARADKALAKIDEIRKANFNNSTCNICNVIRAKCSC